MKGARAWPRRAFLAGAMGALPAAAFAGPGSEEKPPRYLSARADGTGGFRAAGIGADGGNRFDVALPARGHAMTVRPGHPDVAFFARRPGTFALVVDARNGRRRATIGAVAGRWFNGHGIYGGDGRLLFATETDEDTGDGFVGIYDAAGGYRRIGEWPSGGLDPHEIRLLPDGRTLAVANGGILRTKDMPRAKLNVPTMAPALVYLDAGDGALLRSVAPPPALHRLSIRHLAVAGQYGVAVAMQYEGPAEDGAPLVALHRRGDAGFRLIGPPRDLLHRFRRYCGSVAYEPSARILGVTSPRGGIAAFWDLRRDRFLGLHRMADCCGIAVTGAPGRFVISNGHGALRVVDGRDPAAGVALESGFPNARWDNHMLAI